MLNVSTEFRTKMMSDRRFTYQAVITFLNGAILELSEGDLVVSGSHVCVSGESDSLPVGNCISKALTLVLYNDDDRFADRDFFGAVITLTLKYRLSETIEPLDLGTFTVTEPEQYGSTVTLTGYDGMYKADRTFDLNEAPLPISAHDLYIQACDYCGLAHPTASFANDDYQIKNVPDGMTCRQIFGMVAMIAGGNAIYKNGGVQIIPYDTAFFDANPEYDGAVVAPETYQDYNRAHLLTDAVTQTLSTDDVMITGVSLEAGDDGVEVGTDEYMLALENDLAEGNASDAAERILEALEGLRIRPFTIDSVSYPLAEFGDLCYVVDRKGIAHQSIITEIDFMLHGYTTLKCTARSPIRNASAYYPAAGQARVIQRTRKLTEEALSTFGTESQRINDLIMNSMGMFITEETDESGGKTVYLHDKPELSNSQKIWRRNASGFVVSDDGGQTWNAAMTAEGKAYINMLSAIQINANWIEAGALTIRDEFGNVIFKADMDNKSIYISGDSVYIGTETATEALANVNGQLNVILTNEQQMVPVDQDGNYSSFPDVSTDVHVMYGSTDVTASSVFALTEVNVAGTFTNTGGVCRYAASGITEDSGYVVIQAAYQSNGETFRASKRFNIAKAYAGGNGPAGAPARSYFIESGQPLIKLGADGAFNPPVVTYTAWYRDGIETEKHPYSGLFKVEVSEDGTDWRTVENMTETKTGTSYTPTDPKIRNIRCTLYEGSELENTYYVLGTGAASTALSTGSDSVLLYADLHQEVVGVANQLDVQNTVVVVDVDALSQEQVFDILTNDGETQGIYLFHNKLYINASYIQSGILSTVLIKDAKKSNNYWNLSTGEFSLDTSVKVGGAGGTLGGMVTRIQTNEDGLAAEVSRAKGTENELSTRITQTDADIKAEVTRATRQEGTLSSRITANASAITSEVTRAKNEEDKISTKITQTSENLTAEITRATRAEDALSTRITANATSITSEVTRAKASESSLSSRITQTSDRISAEVSRATKREGELSASITANADAITTRVTTAQAESLIEQKASSIRLKATTLTWTAANSSLTQDGTLTVNAGVFKARLDSPTGKIGGWTLESNRLYNKKSITIYGASPSTHTYTAELRSYDYNANAYAFIVTDKNETTSSSKVAFAVKYDGTMTAAKGTIGPWSIDSDGIYTGSYVSPVMANVIMPEIGEEVILPGTTGLFLGSNGITVHAGNFFVSKGGEMYAKKALLGDILFKANQTIDFPHGISMNTSKTDEYGGIVVKNGKISIEGEYGDTTIVGDTLKITDTTSGVSNAYTLRAEPGSGIRTTFDVTCNTLNCTGAKSRIAETSDYGMRKLYCYEMPSPMFGDIGDGVIGEDGLCYISIDPVFAQTISNAEYQVFLQPYGEGACHVYSRSGSCFIVAGTPGLLFGWELKAKQADFDQLRLESGMESVNTATRNYGLDAEKHIAGISAERSIA